LNGNAALRVKVQWLGRGPSPSDRWALPVTLSLSSPREAKLLGKYQGTTDRNGVGFFTNLPVGTYNVHVKGPHNLQSARAAVLLSANSTADVDMKAQVDGDVDGDNCVTVNDFMTVQGMLGAHRDLPGFVPEADLNGDGIVSMTDISLLRSGFERCGDVSADNEFRAMSSTSAPMLSQALAPWINPAALQHTLALRVLPGSPSVRAGETFEVSVLLDAGSQPVDGASFVLRYDAARFAPVDGSGNVAKQLEPGYTLPAVMSNWVDAQGGALGYAAGILQGEPPMGTLLLAKARLRALPNVGTGPALITFDAVSSPHVQVTNGGENLLAAAHETVVTVNP
jgi:hypothetical protein